MEERIRVIRELNKHYAVIKTDILATDLSMAAKILYLVLGVMADQKKTIDDEVIKKMTGIKTDEYLYQALDELVSNRLIEYDNITGTITLID